MLSLFDRAAARAHASATPTETGARRTDRLRVVLLVAGVLGAIACTAAPAGAKVVTDSVTHKKFGIVPTTAARNTVGAACIAENSDCTKLSYNGGPVQHAERDYLFFWTPSGHSTASAYRAGLTTWLSEFAALKYTAGNPFSVNQQYYDNSGAGGTHSFVPYAVTYGGTIVDTAAYPASGCPLGGLSVCLTDAQLAAQLSSYLTSHPTLPKGINTEYFIMTPVNVRSCFDAGGTSCSYTSFCGYHSFTGSGATQIVYADMPWAYNVSGCDVNLAFGAGYANADGIDPVVGIFSHELSETMTDPNLNAWIQNGGTDNGDEIGDKCAYIYGGGGYGSTSGLSNNGLGFWNVAAGGDQYLMQLEFDNRISSCAIKDTDTQPALTISIVPNPPVHGSSATFTAHVTDALGVAYVRWTFGDGATATTPGTSCTGTSPTFSCSITHTYAVAYPSPGIPVIAIATDKDGNEKNVVQTITVS